MLLRSHPYHIFTNKNEAVTDVWIFFCVESLLIHSTGWGWAYFSPFVIRKSFFLANEFGKFMELNDDNLLFSQTMWFHFYSYFHSPSIVAVMCIRLVLNHFYFLIRWCCPLWNRMLREQALSKRRGKFWKRK